VSRLGVRALGFVALAAIVAGALVRYRQSRRVLSVEVAVVTREDVVQSLAAITASVEPREERIVAADRAGRIAELRARLGQTVRRGDGIAVLADPLLEAEVSQAELDVDRAARDLERTRRLRTSELVAPAELEAAEYQYRSAVARARLLEARRNQLIIRAPISGTVTVEHAKAGEVLGGSVEGLQRSLAFPVVSIATTRDLVVRAYFDEADIPQVRRGQEAVVAVDALEGRTIRGVVQRVAPVPSLAAAGSSYEVLISLTETANTLLPGLDADVRVLVARAAGAAGVPREAVFPCGSRHSCVFALAGNRAAIRPVETGISSASRVEIRSGLSIADTVLVGFPPQLADGARVSVRSGRP
jgi:RND family efflux transporter MFP subunit